MYDAGRATQAVIYDLRSDEMLMGSDPASENGSNNILPLCESCGILNERRIELDQRLTTLPADDCQQDLLWSELEAIATELSDRVTRLAAIRSAKPSELRAKARVLAVLLQVSCADSVALSPEATALATSVADDIARLI